MNIVRKEVYLLVHLFLFLSLSYSEIYGQSVNFFSGEMKAHYDQVLNYNVSEWPIVSRNPLEGDQSIQAIYINSLSGTFRQIFNKEPIPNEFYSAWEQNLKTQIANPHAKFCLAELYLHRCVAQFYNKKELKAYFDFRQAYKLANSLHAEYPHYLPVLKTIGILQLMLGAVPEKYTWLLNLMGYSGNISTGIHHLNVLTKQSREFQTEAKIFEVVFSQYLLDQNAQMLAEDVYNDNKDSQIARVVYNSIALKTNTSDKILVDTRPSSIPLVNVQIGEAYLNKLETEKAIGFFEAYLKENPSMASPEMLLKYWISAYLMGDSALMYDIKMKIITHANPINDADDYAKVVVSREALPHLLNVKLRLLTDGGYFDRAEQLIASAAMADFKTEIDLVEFRYRKARLYHLQGNLAKAKYEYLEVLQKEQIANDYIFPNSAYQLANLYMSIGEMDAAKKYYQKVLKYSNYAYENNLKQKAKLKVNQLEKKK